MARVPVVRSEGLEFLGGLGRHKVFASVGQLHEQWLEWRKANGLEPAAAGERTFRQLLNSMERVGEIAQLRNKEGDIVGVEVKAQTSVGLGDRLRHLERERALMWGRAVESSPEAERNLWSLNTPALNRYLAKRRKALQSRQHLIAAGLDPRQISDITEPLGEEALALKERVLRLERELISRGGNLEFLAVPLQVARRSEAAASVRSRRRTKATVAA